MPIAKIVDNEKDLEEIIQAVQTVAVVGMKDENSSDLPSFRIPLAVQARGIRVIPVNPKLENAIGEQAYPNLAAVEPSFDMVNVFRRSEAIPGLAEEILRLPKKKQPKVVWLQAGIRHDEAAKTLVNGGITVVMDRCLGVFVSRYRR